MSGERERSTGIDNCTPEKRRGMDSSSGTRAQGQKDPSLMTAAQERRDSKETIGAHKERDTCAKTLAMRWIEPCSQVRA